MSDQTTHQPPALEAVRQYLARQVSEASSIGAATPAGPEKRLPPALREPLKARVARLLDKVPAEVKQRGIPVVTLQQYLRGRSYQFAHSGEIAGALRALGWVCRRTQSRQAINEGRSGHLWFPPAD